MSIPNYGGPERRKELHAWRVEVDRRFKDGSDTMKALRADLTENTTITKSLQEDTRELLDVLQSLKGAMKVLDMLGRLAKPLGYIVTFLAAVVGLVAVVKGGGVSK
jgi:hypothetical protein